MYECMFACVYVRRSVSPIMRSCILCQHVCVDVSACVTCMHGCMCVCMCVCCHACMHDKCRFGIHSAKCLCGSLPVCMYV